MRCEKHILMRRYWPLVESTPFRRLIDVHLGEMTVPILLFCCPVKKVMVRNEANTIFVAAQKNAVMKIIVRRRRGAQRNVTVHVSELRVARAHVLFLEGDFFRGSGCFHISCTPKTASKARCQIRNWEMSRFRCSQLRVNDVSVVVFVSLVSSPSLTIRRIR